MRDQKKKLYKNGEVWCLMYFVIKLSVQRFIYNCFSVSRKELFADGKHVTVVFCLKQKCRVG